MSNFEQLAKQSIVLSLFSAVFKEQYYKNSLFYRLIDSLVFNASRVLRGSFFGRLIFDDEWETASIKNSWLSKQGLPLLHVAKKLIAHVNTTIKSSIFYQILLGIYEQIYFRPSQVVGYFMFAFIFSSTALKALFSSFTPKALTIRLSLMVAFLLFSLIRLSMHDFFKGSMLIKITCQLIGINNICNEIKSERQSEVSKTQKRLYLGLGFLLGAIYYYLPQITFIKLFGIIFLSFIIYLKPEIGLAIVALALPLIETRYTIGIVAITFVSLLLNYERFRGGFPVSIVPAFFFLITAFVAAAFSLMRSDSLKALPLYIAYFMLFYITSVILREKKTFKLIFSSFIISALVVSLYGIYQYFFAKVSTAMAWVDIEQFPELKTRVYATLENPNVLAEYLGLIIPVLIALIFATKKPCKKAIISICLIPMLLCFLLTFSRGAWLGLAFALVLFAALKEKRLLIILIIVAIISPLFLPEVMVDRIQSIGSLEDSSNTFRITIWIATIRMIKDYWLTGVGLGLSPFSKIYRNYMIAGTPAMHAHNLYLQLGLEMGIAGLLVILWLVISAYSKAFKVMNGESRWSSYIATGILAALSGHLLHGLFDYVWYSPKIVLMFWMMFGMMSALSSKEAIDVKKEGNHG
jgi:O-antigen ligase